MNNKMRTNKSRKGVTLLFTISMIVLFLLMGTTFVVVANDYFKTAERRSGINTYEVNVTALADRAFYDVFRGPSLDDISASLRTHSILEDQYGYGFKANVSSVGVGPVPGLRLVTITGTELTEVVDGSAFDLTTGHFDGALGGCVLTFVSGEARNYSSRIVSSYFTGASLLIVIPTDSFGIDWTLVGGDEIVINGRDFSGTGVGNIVGTTPDFDSPNGLAAKIGNGILTPNRTGQSVATMISGDAGLGIEAYIETRSATCEPYDVADENNWFLSGVDSAGNIIPSFHRDRVYENALTSIGRTVDDIRSFTFRPFYIDSEDLNSDAQVSAMGPGTSRFGEFQEEDDPVGSAHLAGDLVNTANAEEGLDVDTNGDGTVDAVWIDIGLPVQTDDQGRQFKPLVAYRIIDMDGRLNLNAHGSYADAELGVATMRRGGNFGAAEISLSGVIGAGAGDYVALLDARSGTDDGGTHIAGNTNNSLRAAQTLFGYVDHDLNTGNLFGSGADVYGKNVIGRDTSVFGPDSIQGFTMYSALTGSSQVVPYAANLGLGGGTGDSLFQAFEFEAILRDKDIDSALQSSRLRGLGTLEANIDSITTDSAEIAMPPVSVAELLWDESGNSETLYRDFLAAGYLSEEMLMGGLYDLNRPTGNGFDDDGDGTVDDPQELSATAQPNPQFRNNPATANFDLDNAGDGTGGDFLARQRKANQLYILALLVTGDTAPTFAGEFPSVMEYRKAVAQWAVNIVDFIDADSIMTAFEADLNPFNGALTDGDPATDDAGTEDFVVFGAERPELLITETLHTHSRNNQDLSSDGDDTAGGDDDWDSGYTPDSAFFVELYNPWTQLDEINAARFGAPAANASQTPPAELYAQETRGGAEYYGVELQRTAGSSPVWRIGVKREEDDTAFLRTIFFAPISSSTPADARLSGTSDNYYPSGSVDLQVVEPGGYFVVGPSGNAGGGVTTMGRLTGGEDVAMTRRILLNSASPNSIEFYDPGNPLTLPDNSSPDAIPCGVAIVDTAFSDANGMQTRSLSLSVPDGGYTILPGTVQTPENDGTLLEPAIDTPLDAFSGPGLNEVDREKIWTNGVSDEFRFVYLQRLADPTVPFDARSNPYITIDSAEVDLIAFNGLNADADNDESLETGRGSANFYTADGMASTALTSSERGENRDDIMDVRDAMDVAPARRTFFRTADIASADMFVSDDTGLNGGDGHNFSFSFFNTITGRPLHSLGTRNESIGGSLINTTLLPPIPGSDEPLGDLVWLNRPLANSMELVHVPIMPNGGVDAVPMETLLDAFNRSRPIDDIPEVTATSEAQEIFAYYFGDDKFGHLMGFGGMDPAPAGAGEMNAAAAGTAPPSRRVPTQANRFDIMFDFVDVPSKFQGLRKWLDASFVATPATDGMIFNMNAPFNSLPTFREPAKVNLNSMSQDPVFNAIVGSFDSRTVGNGDYGTFETNRNTAAGSSNIISDFAGRYLPGSRTQFVHTDARSDDGAGQAGLFRRAGALREFDVESPDPTNNTDTSSWYENEFRQRLDSIATTRSSVFSIWITIGYFEVDQYGRVGAEIGADEGNARRNRAFYMVDRSIPVACEPGKNHNVDQAVLVRTIIE